MSNNRDVKVAGVAVEFELPNVERGWHRALPAIVKKSEVSFVSEDEDGILYNGLPRIADLVPLRWIAAHPRWLANLWVRQDVGASVPIPPPNYGEKWLCTLLMHQAVNGGWVAIAEPEQFLSFQFTWTWEDWRREQEQRALDAFKEQFFEQERSRRHARSSVR